MSAAPVRARILYIDDDEALAALVRRDFARHAMEVVWAADATRGLTMLAAERFDAVALDHYMPGGDGLDVLQALGSLPHRPPVVYCTGATEGRVAVAALKAGAADYVFKEASEDFLPLLRSAVEDALERDRLKRLAAQAEAEVRAARDRAEVLLREVNHRVGNSLQLVASFILLQSRAVNDETARAALHETKNRIDAVAQVHRRLYTSDDVTHVALDDYFLGLVEELKGSLLDSPEAPTLALRTEPIRVTTDHAVSLGVMVAELITNAVKYAYPTGRGGEIRVRLEGAGAERARLTVEDDGPGLSPGKSPGSTGLGGLILRAMAETIGAKIAYTPAPRGVRAQVEFACLR